MAACAIAFVSSFNVHCRMDCPLVAALAQSLSIGNSGVTGEKGSEKKKTEDRRQKFVAVASVATPPVATAL
jgi:hypothetical protein